MKSLIYLIVFAGIIVSCKESGENSAEEVESSKTMDSTYCNCAELTYDQGYNHFWRFERREGYNGVCETFYSNGQVKEHRPMKEGKNHGKVIYYYESGQVKMVKEFDMNFQTGEQIEYTEDGEVIFHAMYKRGRQTEVLVTRPDLRK